MFYVEISSVFIKYTEHHMATWGYEFYLLVLGVSLREILSARKDKIRMLKIRFEEDNIRVLKVEILSAREDKIRIPSGHVISCIYNILKSPQ